MTLSDRVLRRVVIDIDLNALRLNLAQLRQCCPAAKVFAVLKSDAYGHGAVACAQTLQDADGFAVVHVNEAVQLREAGVRQPILVLQGATTTAEINSLAQHDCTMVVHDASQCRLLEQMTLAQPLSVWLKVDTGMGRLGFAPAAVPDVVKKIRTVPAVELTGVLSHLACADETDNAFTSQQAASFMAVTRTIPGVASSLLNSAGVLAWSEHAFDWVRPGIALYGVNPLDKAMQVPLQPVMTVTAPLIARKLIRQGDGIGYGQSYIAPETMAVGYVAIGYGDGLPRVLNAAQVEVAGQSASVLGRVSMDSIAVDLRGINAQPGDPVRLWGPGLPVERLAEAAGTIGYELLCAIRGLKRYTGA